MSVQNKQYTKFQVPDYEHVFMVYIIRLPINII